MNKHWLVVSLVVIVLLIVLVPSEQAIAINGVCLYLEYEMSPDGYVRAEGNDIFVFSINGWTLACYLVGGPDSNWVAVIMPNMIRYSLASFPPNTPIDRVICDPVGFKEKLIESYRDGFRNPDTHTDIIKKEMDRQKQLSLVQNSETKNKIAGKGGCWCRWRMDCPLLE